MLLGPEDVRSALVDVARMLHADSYAITINVVGGAAIALQMARSTLTGDVDALYLPSQELTEAVEAVGLARGWPANWLNDAANAYASHFDEDSDWTTLIEVGGVVIRLASPELLLAMKLLAGRGRRDAGDIEQLVTLLGLTTVDAVFALFGRFYPQESPSPRAVALVRRYFEPHAELST